jgi:hypothetical protein
MAKKIQLEVEVNDQALDKFQGKLVELQKGLKIQYDIDGKPIDIVIDKSLNLQKQVKLLTAELRRTKEGTAEFTLLSSKLNDAKDNLERVNVKSRDLFASFSLLPGPIGQMFGQLNGVIGLMKTFTGFSLKDFKNQFKELGNDLKDIYNALNGTKKATDDLNNSTEKSTQVQAQQNAATVSAVAAIKDQTKETQLLQVAIDKTGTARIEAVKNIKDMSAAELELFKRQRDQLVHSGNYQEALKNTNVILEKMTISERIHLGVTNLSNKAKIAATTIIDTLTNRQKLYAVATNIAAQATRLFTFALNALAIGAAIFLITKLIEKLGELVTGTNKAEEAAREFSDALQEQNYWLDYNAKELKRRSNEKISQMKAEGKSAKEIRDEELRQAIELNAQLNKDQEDAYNKRRDLLNANRIDETEKAAEDYRRKRDAFLQSESDLKILRNRIKEEEDKEAEQDRKDKEQKQKEEGAKSKQLREEQNRRNLEADAQYKKLLEQNYLSSIADERKREEDQLVIDFENERKRIKNLEISQERKNQLLEQTEIQYQNKKTELNKRFAKEDEDNRKQALEKLNQIDIESKDQEIERKKLEREKDFNDEVNNLKALLDKKIITQQEYDEAVKDLEVALQRDLQEIRDEATRNEEEKAISKLDKELEFLQRRSEAVIEGTHQYYDLLREISKKAEEKEIAELQQSDEFKKANKEEQEKLLTDIQKKYSKERNQITLEEIKTVLEYANQVAGVAQNIVSAFQASNEARMQQELKTAQESSQNIDEFNAKQDDIKKKYFEKNKKAQKAQTIITTFQSAVQAFSSLANIPVVGPILGGIAAAAAIAAGAANVRKIDATTYEQGGGGSMENYYKSKPAADSQIKGLGQNYADGGMIGGRRHAQGGTMIEAEQGEAIMTRGAVTMFKPLLSMMNQAGGGTTFAPNLLTTRYDNPKVVDPQKEENPIIVKTYVVSNELTTEAQKQARLKDLSTL